MAIYAWDHWNNNTLTGGSAAEEFLGGDGDDVIVAGGGNDIVRGQGDNDFLFGEAGEDDVQGGDGRDHLSGGDDGIRDVVSGGNGNDVLHFSGEERYDGGADFDTFSASGMGYYGSGNYQITYLAPQGVRIDLENGVAEDRGTGAATEDFYVPGVLGIGFGDAEFISIEQYELTTFGDYFAGDNSADIILGNGGDDIIEGRGGADDIRGGTGSDTVEYGSSPFGVNVDLQRGTGLIGDAEGDSYTSIENIRGSNHLDALYGDDAANTILGRDGDDQIEGRGGNDVLDGGDGEDTVLYTSSSYGVDVDLRVTTQYSIQGDAYGDTLRNFENVTGSDHTDYLQGNDGANELNGGRGSDLIDGGFGNDFLIGGDDANIADRVSFQSWNPTGPYTPGSEFIRIALGEGSAQGSATRTSLGVLESDVLIGFEDVRGSNRPETIIGNSGANMLEGRGGNDIIDGGRGNDNLVGGDATDTVSFESLDAAGPAPSNEIVSTDLAAGTATRTSINIAFGTATVVETDTLSGFENVRGSNYMDGMLGNAWNNVLEGRGGNDVLSGNGGSDVLNGGDEIDIASYQYNTWRVIAYLGPTGTPGQGFEFGWSSNGETLLSVDTLLGIENLRGSSYNDALYGNEAGNVLDGWLGADDLRGGGGSDIYLVDNAGDSITESGGQGTDTVRTSVSYAITAGADVETLETTNRYSTAAINLTGNNTNNNIFGNNGNNVIAGRDGDDDLTGFGGQDSFLFDTPLDAAGNVDRIIDFNVAADTILLDDAVFGALTPGGFTAGQFRVGATAQDGDDVILYNSATGALFYDSDGVGAAAAIQFAEVTAGLALTNQDFFVV